ncbi:unnamed protein product [Urochloa humidicola]
MMARSVSYVSAAKLVSMARGNPRLAIIDVRDEERSYQAHIAGSHHFASGSFEARMPELVRAASGKDTLVFHCALSQVRGPTSTGDQGGFWDKEHHSIRARV